MCILALKALKKILKKIGQPKLDILKQYQKVALWVSSGPNFWNEGVRCPQPALNLLLIII